MNIGDWVHLSHNMNKITGFITASCDDMVEVLVTIPRNYGALVVCKDQLITGDDTVWMDDIPTLIDLSLQLKDEEWFKKWRHELSLWRPMNNKTDRLLHGLFCED